MTVQGSILYVSILNLRLTMCAKASILMFLFCTSKHNSVQTSRAQHGLQTDIWSTAPPVRSSYTAAHVQCVYVVSHSRNKKVATVKMKDELDNQAVAYTKWTQGSTGQFSNHPNQRLVHDIHNRQANTTHNCKQHPTYHSIMPQKEIKVTFTNHFSLLPKQSVMFHSNTPKSQCALIFAMSSSLATWVSPALLLLYPLVLYTWYRYLEQHQQALMCPKNDVDPRNALILYITFLIITS